MNLTPLAKSDLNLIIAFQALMEEKNVSRAAGRLFISQPAMSNTLNRLRTLFNDPLFTRTPYGIAPTPKAESLYREIPDILAKLDQLIGKDDFQPEAFRGNFRIACEEGFSYQLARLFNRLRQQAPNATIEHFRIPRQYVENLHNGKLDFVIHFYRHGHDDIVADYLGNTPSICLMRENHPLSDKKRLTLKDITAYPHVRHVVHGVTGSGKGVIDELLEPHGLKREIIFKTPFFHSALQIISQSDCLFMTGDMSQSLMLANDKFHAVKIPEELSAPTIRYYLFYHQRVANSAAHQWLRKLILEANSSCHSNAAGGLGINATTREERKTPAAINTSTGS